MKKRIFAMLVAAVLAFTLLPTAAFAGGGTWFTIIDVDGTVHEIGNGGYASAGTSGDGWSWDWDTQTLTLDGFHGRSIGFGTYGWKLVLAEGSHNTLTNWMSLSDGNPELAESAKYAPTILEGTGELIIDQTGEGTEPDYAFQTVEIYGYPVTIAENLRITGGTETGADGTLTLEEYKKGNDPDYLKRARAVTASGEKATYVRIAPVRIFYAPKDPVGTLTRPLDPVKPVDPTPVKPEPLDPTPSTPVEPGPTPAASIGTTQYSTLQAAVDAVPNNGYIDILSLQSLRATVSREVTFTLRPGTQGISALTERNVLFYFDGVCRMTEIPSSGSLKCEFTKAGGTDPVDPDPVTPDVPDTPVIEFTDVADWCSPAVDWAVENGITNGTARDKFSPSKECTHAQILTFLYRAARSGGTPAAEDMDKAVAWAKEKGMIDDSFDGSEFCTRADTVSYIWHAMNKETVAASSFPDVDAGASYAAAVNWAVGNGIVVGYEDGTFRPDRVCNRGEIVTILHRVYAPEVRVN